MKIWLLFLLLLPGLSLAMATPKQKPVVAAPGNSGVMLRDDVVKASPSSAADSVAKLGRGDKVRVLTNEGGWTQVYASGRTGWVRILSVKSEASATADLSALAEAGKRPSDPGKVVAVAGARGLDEVELKSARYDPEELTLLDTYISSRAEAEQFAQQYSLVRRDFSYLPNPENRASPSSMSKQP